MGTLTGLLDASRGALLAEQTAINATAQNISNQNTPGYARRVATWQVQDSVSLNGVSTGRGVTVSITAQRDSVLDSSVERQTAVASASSTHLQALQQLQGAFSLGITGSDASGIGAAISGLFTSASTLAANGSDPAARQAVFAAAQTFAGALNRTSASIAAQGASLDQQVGNAVGQVNTLLTQYAKINGRITTSGAADVSALEDQRQALLGQIAQLAGAHQVRADGNGISLILGNGSLLVSGSQAYGLTTTVAGGQTHILAADGADLTGTLQGGSLGGLLQARDGDLPAVSHSLDLLATAVGTAVNTANAAGLDANGNPGGPVFALPAGQPAAGAIRVALADSSGIAAAGVLEGAGGGSNAAAIAAIAGQPLSLLSGQTASEAFTSTLAGLGSTVSAANAASQGDTATLTQVQSQQNAISGVSLDQEGANLTQLQRSYEASAKVLSIVNSLLATAINIGTPTTVS